MFIWIILSLLGELKRGFGDLNIKNNIHSWRPSSIDNNLIHDLVNRNPQITTEDFTDRLYLDN